MIQPMSWSQQRIQPILDQLDRQIVCSLQLDGRASWGRIAEVLEVPERTVARRGLRLLGDKTLRMHAVPSTSTSPQDAELLVRLVCDHGTTLDVAMTLARNPNAYYVGVTSGSSDVYVTVYARGRGQTGALAEQLIGARGVRHATAHTMLRLFTDASQWQAGALTDEQATRLRRPLIVGRKPSLDALDHELMRLLGQDARASAATLSAQLSASHTTVRRRLQSLFDTQVIRAQATIDLALLGMPVETVIWLDIHASRLEDAGKQLAREPAVRFAIATTGPSNLVAMAAFADLDALYTFLTGTVGALPGLLGSGVTPIVRVIKRGGGTLVPTSSTGRV